MHAIELIYIPIWLDLLYLVTRDYACDRINLHSNMVRFIIYERRARDSRAEKFTFQYG